MAFHTSGWNNPNFAFYCQRALFVICDNYNSVICDIYDSLFSLLGVTDPKCLAARMPSIVAESGGNGHAFTIA